MNYNYESYQSFIIINFIFYYMIINHSFFFLRIKTFQNAQYENLLNDIEIK